MGKSFSALAAKHVLVGRVADGAIIQDVVILLVVAVWALHNFSKACWL
jgi:hypothetical protein